MHIIIIDPISIHRKSLEGLLSQVVRTSLTSWSDGESAIGHYQSIRNEIETFLFLIDTQHSSIDGIDIIKQVRSFEDTKSYTPSSIIVMTDHETANIQVLSKLVGADSILNKPVLKGDLFKEMRRSMGEENIILANEL
jgi:CheY-like chemotaxis protein